MPDAGGPTVVAADVRDVVMVEGPDAVGYLQGQLSQDVAALAVGASALSFLLEPQGRIVAVLRVVRTTEERLELDVEAGLGEAVVARLQRFKLRTKAEITLEPAVPHAVHRGAGPAPDGALVPTTPGADGWDTRGGVASDDGAEPGAAVVEAERIRLGIPAARDLDERAVPAETGLVEAAASFTKGCYTGQELVARMDSRAAQPPRRIRRITGDGAAPPIGSTTVDAGGRDAGTLTSVAETAYGWVALALVPRAVDAGAVTVTAPDGTASAAVVEP
jgi:folate-binding protein YgfZ